MNIKLWVSIHVVFSSVLLLASGTGLKLADFSKINGAGRLSATTFEGEELIRAQGVINFKSKELFPIDNKKIYKFSGDFKVVPDTKPAKFYFGIIYYDEQKRIISPEHFLVVANSMTEVTADALKGTTTLKVKDASKWKKGAVYYVAFNAKADLSDIPNRNLMSNIKNIEKKDDHWEITFAKGLPYDVKAGTIIRQQYTGSSYSYSMAGSLPLPAEWKTFSALIKGESRNGRMSFSNIWPGAKYASFVVLGNNGGNKDSAFMIRNFHIEEISR